MAKIQEELNNLKKEYEDFSNKLKKLTQDELNEASGERQVLTNHSLSQLF